MAKSDNRMARDRRAAAAPAQKRTSAPARTSSPARVNDERGREIVLGESSLATLAPPAKPKVYTVRAKEKKKISPGTIFLVLLCMVILMLFVINEVKVNEVTREVNALGDEINALRSEATDLTDRLSRKNTSSELEERAQQMGLLKSGDLSSVTVHIPREDTVEKYDEKEEDEGVLTSVLSAIGSNIRDGEGLIHPPAPEQ